MVERAGENDFLQAPPPMGHLSEVEIAEARMRLVVGLKRYFHGKRVEGLLSTAVTLFLLLPLLLRRSHRSQGLLRNSGGSLRCSVHRICHLLEYLAVGLR